MKVKHKTTLTITYDDILLLTENHRKKNPLEDGKAFTVTLNNTIEDMDKSSVGISIEWETEEDA